MFLIVCYVWIYERQMPQIPDKNGIVVEMKTVKNGYRYTVKYGLFNYHLYTNDVIDIGQIIEVEGAFEVYETDQFQGDFSNRDYYKARFVYYVIYEPNMTLKNKIWIPHMIHYELLKHIESLETYTQVFCKSLVLGIFETDYKEQISHIGITHLFVLSGLHVSMLIGMIDQALFFIPKKGKKVIETGLLFGYLMITLFPVSLIRAVIQYVLYEWLNIKKETNTRLDVFSFTFIGMLIMNPFYFNQVSFQLSFLVSFLFILSRFKTDFMGSITSTFYAQTLVLPITSKITQQLYPIAFLVTPIFIPLFNYVLLPLSWLALLHPFSQIIEPLFKQVITLITFLEYQAIALDIPVLMGISAVIYFVLWIYAYVCEDKFNQVTRYLFVVLFILILPYFKYMNPVGKVVFLSVGQGDTTIIERPNRSCTVVIDAFGDVVSYLKYNQITYIDYLIITHGDYDHHRETVNILNHIEVGSLVLSTYDQSGFNEEMKTYRPTLVEAGDQLGCGDIKLNILSPFNALDGNNDNSIVIQTTINQMRYLFTGDIEYDAEKALINHYDQALQSDVLKVGHHGSKSSTNLSFLSVVNPTYAIVSVGLNNHFGHPHPSVIERLKQQQIKIYQTSQVGTIYFIDLPFYRYNVILVHKRG